MQAELGLSQTTETWSQWRGPYRDGKIASTSTAWPDSISEQRLKPIWDKPLFAGYSSPVISNGQVFTVGTRSEKFEIARAFEITTGEQKWFQEWDGAMKVPFFAKSNGSWVRATPATDGESLFVSGMRDVLVNIDIQSGKEIWRIDFTKRESSDLPSFGYVSSPLIDGDYLYVQAGMAVTKIDKKSGKTLWRSMEDRRAMFASAFSSPCIATIHNKRQLVVQTRATLAGLDLDTGKVLWSTPIEAFRGMNILTPTIIENRVFTASYGGGSFYFDILKTDDGFSVKTIWRNKEIEAYMSSPIVIGDYIYLHAKNQKFYCIDLKNGKPKWSSEEKFGKYWSMIANGNRILALDQRGTLILIDASPEKFKLMERQKISKEDTWAHLAIEGDTIFVRGLEKITAYKWN